MSEKKALNYWTNVNDSVLALSCVEQGTKAIAMDFWQSKRNRCLYMECSHFMFLLCL